MKNLILVSISLLLLTTSCNQEELDKLKAEQLEYIESNGEQNSQINALLDEMNYIANNLQVIREKQGVYATLSIEDDVEFTTTPEDKIRSEVEMIDYLMTNNLDRISALEKKLEKGGDELKSVRKLLSTFKEDVVAKSAEIEGLKNEIIQIEGQYSDLMDDYMNSKIYTELQGKLLLQTEDELNKVYYAYGTKAELLEHNVIQKKGGVLGFGAANILKGDFNKDYFTQADSRSFEGIPIAKKKVELLTEHPGDSYELVQSENNLISELKIKDSKEFWRGSKYLVILTK